MCNLQPRKGSLIKMVQVVGIEPTMFTTRVTDFKSVAFQPASPHLHIFNISKNLFTNTIYYLFLVVVYLCALFSHPFIILFLVSLKFFFLSISKLGFSSHIISSVIFNIMNNIFYNLIS